MLGTSQILLAGNAPLTRMLGYRCLFLNRRAYPLRASLDPHILSAMI
jgi:hypothetical protein